uniref:Uncharacterized protein n=1 Tax=Plectus sambesii TaxID=2011161 RepID=A0A914VJD8_9BILA
MPRPVPLPVPPPLLPSTTSTPSPSPAPSPGGPPSKVARMSAPPAVAKTQGNNQSSSTPIASQTPASAKTPSTERRKLSGEVRATDI